MINNPEFSQQLPIKQDFFAQIEWPKTPALRDPELWDRSINLVKRFCIMAEDVEWLDGKEGIDTYTHMPMRYSIDGVQVEFLPHWGFVTIDGVYLDPAEALQRVK